MAVLCIFVIARAVYIQRVQGNFWKAMSDSLHIKPEAIIAERGSILSADGSMLSTSVPVFDVYMDCMAGGLREKNGKRFHDNLDSLSISLANLFKDTTAEAWKAKLMNAWREEDRFFPIKKKITFDQYLILRQCPLVRQGRNKSGFVVETKDRRINPFGMLASRTIGLSRTNSQNVGLEGTYDSLLRGMPGQRLVRYNAGAWVPVEGSELEPIRGKDVITSLDTYMQDVTEAALMRMMVNNKSVCGTAIVMETATGKIKAIANLGLNAKDSSYYEDMNYGVGRSTEPGSIFKLATLMALLEDGLVDTGTIVKCYNGVKYFSGLRIKDAHAMPAEMTMREAFAQSSNVAFAELANEHYGNNPQPFLDHLHKMRLDTATEIDIVAKSGRPRIKKRSAKDWSKTTIPFMAHGYESSVTPLHMLTLYNAVANGGKMMRPYLVTEIRDLGITVQKFEPKVLDPQICSPANVGKLQGCMEEVVAGKHGTAHSIFDSAYRIAGKTGTAVSVQGNKGYNKSSKTYQASFIGYFPADAPKYTIAVVIQNSRLSSQVYGASVSGKVFKEISDKIYTRYLTGPAKMEAGIDSLSYTASGRKKDLASITSFLNIPVADGAVSGAWRTAALTNSHASMTAANGSPEGLMPDLRGMGLKDAVYITENRGYRIAAKGKGKIVSQSVEPGTPLKRGERINIFLN